MIIEELTKRLQYEVKLLNTITQEHLECKARISVFEDLIAEMNAKKKELTENELISVATEIISENPEMQRVTLIAAKLRKNGFEFDGDLLAKKLLKTGKFGINKETKYWEIKL